MSLRFYILKYGISSVIGYFRMFQNILIYSQITFKLFTSSCLLANTALKVKTFTTAVYTTSLKILGFVLGGLSKVFKLVAVGIRILSVAMMSNPIGLILSGIALVAGLIIANWDKVKAWFMSFIEWLRPIWEPIVELFSLAWQSIGDFFYNIFGGMFEWFGDKLSWVGDAISSVSGFVNDALSFVGLGDDEKKIENSKQEKILSPQSLTEKTPQTLNTNSNFSSGTINVNVSGTFNIATQNGNFNMNEFALAVEKNVLLALKKQEQNKANTTIYG